jgi:hypothetical protein
MTTTAEGAEQKPYKIGWGQPPIEHQFQKGRSGNSRGRPRRSAKPPEPLRPLNEIVLAEAHRLVAVRDGEKIVQMPMIQATIRAMGLDAIKGGRLAKAGYLRVVQAAESEALNKQETSFEGMLDYKMRLTRLIEDAVRKGHPAPNPIPHPDDLIVNLNRGEIRIVGPRDEREKALWDDMQVRRHEALDEIAEYRKEMKGKPGPHAIAEAEIHLQQWYADRIQSLFPDEAMRRSPFFAVDDWPPTDEDGNIMLARYKPAKPAELS